MAVTCLSAEKIAEIRAVYAETGNTIETARRVGVNRESVRKYRDETVAKPSTDATRTYHNPRPPFVPVSSMTPPVQYDPRDVAFPEPAADFIRADRLAETVRVMEQDRCTTTTPRRPAT